MKTYEVEHAEEIVPFLTKLTDKQHSMQVIGRQDWYDRLLFPTPHLVARAAVFRGMPNGSNFISDGGYTHFSSRPTEAAFDEHDTQLMTTQHLKGPKRKLGSLSLLSSNFVTTGEKTIGFTSILDSRAPYIANTPGSFFSHSFPDTARIYFEIDTTTQASPINSALAAAAGVLHYLKDDIDPAQSSDLEAEAHAARTDFPLSDEDIQEYIDGLFNY